MRCKIFPSNSFCLLVLVPHRLISVSVVTFYAKYTVFTKFVIHT